MSATACRWWTRLALLLWASACTQHGDPTPQETGIWIAADGATKTMSTADLLTAQRLRMLATPGPDVVVFDDEIPSGARVVLRRHVTVVGRDDRGARVYWGRIEMQEGGSLTVEGAQ